MNTAHTSDLLWTVSIAVFYVDCLCAKWHRSSTARSSSEIAVAAKWRPQSMDERSRVCFVCLSVFFCYPSFARPLLLLPVSLYDILLEPIAVKPDVQNEPNRPLATCSCLFMHGHFRHTPTMRSCRSFGCVLLLNQIYLTTVYRSTIPHRFIWSICSGN